MEKDWSMSVSGDFIIKLLAFCKAISTVLGECKKNFSATIKYDAETDKYKITPKFE